MANDSAPRPIHRRKPYQPLQRSTPKTSDHHAVKLLHLIASRPTRTISTYGSAGIGRCGNLHRRGGFIGYRRGLNRIVKRTSPFPTSTQNFRDSTMSTIDGGHSCAGPTENMAPKPKSGYPVHWGRLNRQYTISDIIKAIIAFFDVHLSHHFMASVAVSSLASSRMNSATSFEELNRRVKI